MPYLVGAVAALVLLTAACGSKTGLLVDESTRDGAAGAAAGLGDAGRSMDGAPRGGDDAGALDGAAEAVDARADDGGTAVGGDGGDADAIGPVAGVAAGAQHTCAWRATGEVECWGSNEFGQAGSPASALAVRTPTFVPGAVAVQMALGARHTCALDADGGVTCWGLNTWGMLGTDGPDHTDRPQRVPGLPPIARLAAGWSHTCAVAVGGEVFCWGKNDGGQIGSGTSADAHRPVLVGPIGPAVDVAAGRGHTCAVTADGLVYCWGANFADQRGTDGGNVFLPVLVPDIRAMVAVRAGEASTCALGSDGRLRCWGELAHTASWCEYPCPPGACEDRERHPVVAFPERVDDLCLGKRHACLVDAPLGLHCWGDNDRRQLGLDPTVGGCPGEVCTEADPCVVAAPAAVDGVHGVLSITAGREHTCAVDGRRAVYCWGDNRRLQAGSDGAFVPRPTRVPGI